jgi:hypothetical protein
MKNETWCRWDDFVIAAMFVGFCAAVGVGVL